MRIVTLLAAIAVASPTTYPISQKNKLFSASTITVKPGDDVTFSNDDAVVHNVFSVTLGMAFNLKTQAPGVTARISFDKEGTADVRCAIHPTMKLSIVVKR